MRWVVFLVTLDVKNTFKKPEKCSCMIQALEYTFQVPKYLLRKHILLYEIMEGEQWKAVTARAVQASILGPDLWIVLYDTFLITELPE